MFKCLINWIISKKLKDWKIYLNKFWLWSYTNLLFESLLSKLYLKYKNLKKEITDNHKFQIVAYEVEEENEQNINESQISELIKTNNKNPNEIKKIKAKFIYDENILKKEELKQKKNKPEDLNPTEGDKNKIKSLKIEIVENQTKYKDLKFEFSQLEAKIKELSKNQILSIKLELNKDKLEHVEKIPGFLVAFLCFIAFLFGYFLTS